LKTKHALYMLILPLLIFVMSIFGGSALNGFIAGAVIYTLSIFAFAPLQKFIQNYAKEDVVEAIDNLETDAEMYEKQLFNINYAIRVKPLSTNILVAAESVIDKVRDLLEIVNREGNFSELTVTVNRIPVKYLPSIIDPLLEMTPEKRLEVETSVIGNLEAIDIELINIRTALDNNEQGKYQRMSTLIDTLFEQNNVGDFNV